jgi:hypothetical protein
MKKNMVILATMAEVVARIGKQFMKDPIKLQTKFRFCYGFT